MVPSIKTNALKLKTAIHSPPPPPSPVSPVTVCVHVVLTSLLCGTFVVIYEPILIYDDGLKTMVYI